MSTAARRRQQRKGPKAAEAELQLVQDIAQFEHDPLGYVLYAYPWGREGTELAKEKGPRKWQRRVLEALGRHLRNGATVHQVFRIAVASGHGIGKSALIAWLVEWAMATRENTRGVITANTDRQLRTKTQPEVAKWHRLSIVSHWFVCTATSYYSTDPEHKDTWRLDFVPWSDSNTEAFAGLHNRGNRIILLMDEASAIADKVWEVAEGALTDSDTEIMWVAFGNPTRATGRFRDCFRKFRHRWFRWNIDSREVEGTNRELLDSWVEDYGEDSDFVRVRVRGLFPRQSAKQFISEADVEAAQQRQLRKEQYSFAPRIIAVEPAWEGDDELVIGIRQGLMFEILHTMPKNDNDVWVANLVARLEDEHRADAVFVDGGYGTGVVSAGRTMGRDWTIVWFSEHSADPGCLNKRAEMWKGARDWLKAGGAIDPRDQVLADDLTAPETVARLDGKLQLERKDAMKARGVPSPNRGDCLALTFAHPVVPRIGPQGRSGSDRLEHDYDPLAA